MRWLLSRTTANRLRADPSQQFALRVRNKAVRIAASLRIRATDTVPLTRVGSAYGGWWVPKSTLRDGAIIYCAGAGEDITFDLAMHDAGCLVRTFDPTPRAIAHVENVAPSSDRFAFLPIGLWIEDRDLRFYAPSVNGFVSHSAVNLHGTSEYFTAPVKTLASLMHTFGDDEIDVLKMDIEGAEVAVIHALIDDGTLPPVLCVEFDQPQPLKNVRTAVQQLADAGARLVKVEGWNYTFVQC